MLRRRLAERNIKRGMREAGDTLVEVMLAMAIVASVLGAAYATASRALRTGRQAQDRTEALRYVESQIEQLKFLAKGTTAYSPFNPPSNPFCVNSTQEIVAASNPGCKYGTFYNITVQYAAANPAGLPENNQDDRFTVSATWDRIGGGTDEMKIVYKMHPGLE